MESGIKVNTSNRIRLALALTTAPPQEPRPRSMAYDQSHPPGPSVVDLGDPTDSNQLGVL
ncbi:MAG: hypothetical protein PVF70_05200 [Anaerolineales bacterium]